MNFYDCFAGNNLISKLIYTYYMFDLKSALKYNDTIVRRKL